MAAGGFGANATRYAGDWYLWQRFAQHQPLVKVQAILSAFRQHGEQITATPLVYEQEVPPPPRPSFGLLLHNQALALSRQYPKLAQLPNGFKCALRLGLQTTFRIDPRLFPASLVKWCAESRTWEREFYP